MTQRTTRPIALVGLMGSGKTAVARVLGERLGVAAADLDAMVEAVEGVPVAELFERSGEAWFRRREGELLDQVIRSGVRVIACGGGIVLDPERRRMLRDRCRVVWLEVSPEEAARRVAAEPGRRPLLSGHDPGPRLAALLAERAPLYEQVAHVRVTTDGRAADAVATAVLDALAAAAA